MLLPSQVQDLVDYYLDPVIYHIPAPRLGGALDKEGGKAGHAGHYANPANGSSGSLVEIVGPLLRPERSSTTRRHYRHQQAVSVFRHSAASPRTLLEKATIPGSD